MLTRWLPGFNWQQQYSERRWEVISVHCAAAEADKNSYWRRSGFGHPYSVRCRWWRQGHEPCSAAWWTGLLSATVTNWPSLTADMWRARWIPSCRRSTSADSTSSTLQYRLRKPADDLWQSADLALNNWHHRSVCHRRRRGQGRLHKGEWCEMHHGENWGEMLWW